MEKISMSKILEARYLLRNPYAFLDETGSYSASAQPKGDATDLVKVMRKSRRYSDRQIENKATDLLRQLWLRRSQIWDDAPSDPLAVIDPAKALELTGFDFSFEEELEPYSDSVSKVAGIINGDAKKVYISKRFPTNVQAFTAAHELGHAVLHDISAAVHRDRPIDGTSFRRDPMEREADKFAAFFLMPAKLVRLRFVETFGTDTFSLTEETAFALTNTSLMDARRKYSSLRDVSQLVAGASSYNGLQFYSLTDQFCVSVKAMAIRLEELDLIYNPT